MDIVNKNIENYIEEHTSEISKVLYDLDRETHIKVLRPRMLSGAVQGKLLELLVKMSGSKNILEIGTYTGFSAISMASALPNNGHLTTIDINAELEAIVNKYIKLSKLNNKISYYIGDAINILPTIECNFDFVFIDADKVNYLNYYNLLIDKLPKNAWIIADNVLWSGKVLSEPKVNDIDTKALQEFNDFIQNDNRVENVLLSIRDGLMVIRKR